MAGDMFKKGERNAVVIRSAVDSFINNHPFTRIDYIVLADPTTLEEKEILGDEALVALAVMVGKTRLIDNMVLTGE